MNEEKLFRSIGGVGEDLIDMAENRRFAPGPWRKWGPLAACLALLVGLTAVALPHFSAQKTASPAARPSQTEAVSIETPSEDSAVPEMEASVEGTLQDKEGLASAEMEPAARERLTFEDLVYYVEARYEDSDGVTVRGTYLGRVSDADVADRTGCAVYRFDTAAEDQAGPAQQILVHIEDGYLQCRTYGQTAGAPCDEAALLDLLENGQSAAVLDRLVTDLERSGGAIWEFSDPSQLTADQLTDFALLTLRMELDDAGWETLCADLWYNEDWDAYVIPVEDVTRQLDRYLETYVFLPEEATAYDPVWNALILTELPSISDPAELNLSYWEYDEVNRLLLLTVERPDDAAGTARVYAIQFTDDACYYRHIYLWEDPSPETEAAAEP